MHNHIETSSLVFLSLTSTILGSVPQPFTVGAAFGLALLTYVPFIFYLGLVGWSSFRSNKTLQRMVSKAKMRLSLSLADVTADNPKDPQVELPTPTDTAAPAPIDLVQS